MTPAAAAPAALLLAPGASASRDHPSLVSIDEAVRAAYPGVVVERIDLPRGKAERAVPAVAAAAAALVEGGGRSGGRRRVFLGGRSFGGRVCSMAVAAGDVPSGVVGGLVLISYPLHPPGKPALLRTEHFPALPVPCLFVSGTRDAFHGSRPEALEAATASIPGPVTHVWVEGGDHGLRGRDAEVAAAVAGWLSSAGG
jgi:predicted alpha/beta-hydrolase family hydrolase